MDKSPILPAEHDAGCRRRAAGDLDVERCERCRNLLARLDQWRGSGKALAADPMATVERGAVADTDPGRLGDHGA